jgi:hypothetical protein
MNAESKGKHFHKFIKGQYPCSKIEDWNGKLRKKRKVL